MNMFKLKLDYLEVPEVLKKKIIAEGNFIYALENKQNTFWASFCTQRGGCTVEQTHELAGAVAALPDMVKALSQVYQTAILNEEERKHLAELLARVGVSQR